MTELARLIGSLRTILFLLEEMIKIAEKSKIITIVKQLTVLTDLVREELRKIGAADQ